MQQPLREDTDISKYQEYLDLITATVFPITMDDDRDIYGIGVPFRFAIFYYSDRFRQIFSEDGKELMAVPKGISVDKVRRDKLYWLYKMILERWLQHDHQLRPGTDPSHRELRKPASPNTSRCI